MQDTRAIAKEYRLAHWAGIMSDRAASGLSIRNYCKQAGFHENIYYYWQRKLRAASAELLQSTLTMSTETAIPPQAEAATLTGTNAHSRNAGLIPSGWLACSAAIPTENNSHMLTVEVNRCRITVSTDTDLELLSKVCQVLSLPC